MIEDRILVVDDEDAIRKQLVRATRRRVRHVDEAADGLEAMRLFSTHYHPLVLLDLRLPKRDGLEVLAEMMHLHPTTKTVIVTAHGTESDAIRALNLGAFHYLKKPFDIGRIEELIDRGYERYRQEDRLTSVEKLRQGSEAITREIDAVYQRLAELAPRAQSDAAAAREFERTMERLRAMQEKDAEWATRLFRASIPLDPTQAYEVLEAARKELGK